MRRAIVLAIAMILFISPTFASDTAPPTIPAKASSASQFVPDGWSLEHEKQGDLNKDGLPDLLLVLRQTYKSNASEPDTFDPLNRMLLVAFRENEGNDYRLALLNTTLIPPRETSSLDDILSEAGDIIISNGTFKVSLYLFMSAAGWDTGTSRFHFRYQNNAFALIGYDRDNTHRSSGKTTETSVNYLTRKAKITTGNIAHDARKITWRKLPKARLLHIDDIEDGLSFDPEINP